MYHVGVGKTSTPTPTGYYAVQYKEVNPTWVDPDDTSIQIGSGPDNPIGYRWIGFTVTMGSMGPIILNPSAATYPMAACA